MQSRLLTKSDDETRCSYDEHKCYLCAFRVRWGWAAACAEFDPRRLNIPGSLCIYCAVWLMIHLS